MNRGKRRLQEPKRVDRGQNCDCQAHVAQIMLGLVEWGGLFLAHLNRNHIEEFDEGNMASADSHVEMLEKFLSGYNRGIRLFERCDCTKYEIKCFSGRLLALHMQARKSIGSDIHPLQHKKSRATASKITSLTSTLVYDTLKKIKSIKSDLLEYEAGVREASGCNSLKP